MTSTPALTPTEERAALAKVTWRLLPLLFICYIIAYIDRINVGFAKLHLQQVLGVDGEVFNSVYGFGAGLFFIGYFIFEVPSNLILQRVGARIWIARIMVFWGIVSALMMFTNGKTMFYIMRFLLGAAEAGFFPGVILYLTFWFTSKERARVVAIFATGGVVAGAIGSPISGGILTMHGFGGLEGWQWLFLIEAIPALILGIVVLVYLPNGPRHATWLTDAEKACINSRLEADAATMTSHREHRFAAIFTNGRVWLLCGIYFLLNVGTYGYELWSPSLFKSFSGKGDFIVGLINAIPYVGAFVAMVLVGRYSDRTGYRRGVVSVAAIASAVGFAVSAYTKNPAIALAALVVAFAGLKSTIAPFWALGTTFLSGAAAAGGIALINSVGNLGGYFGPHIVGMIKDKTDNNTYTLLFLGGALLGMGLLALAVPKDSLKGKGPDTAL